MVQWPGNKFPASPRTWRWDVEAEHPPSGFSSQYKSREQFPSLAISHGGLAYYKTGYGNLPSNVPALGEPSHNDSKLGHMTCFGQQDSNKRDTHRHLKSPRAPRRAFLLLLSPWLPLSVPRLTAGGREPRGDGAPSSRAS